MRRFAWIAGISAVLAAEIATGHAAEPLIAGRAKVHDAGAISIGARRIAIAGISAPGARRTCQEWRGRTQAPYPCGAHAKAFLASLVDGKTVYCVPMGEPRHNVRPARCFADGQDLGEALVAAGWATATTESRRYIAAQESARAAQRGMWAGSFDPPRKGGDHPGRKNR